MPRVLTHVNPDGDHTCEARRRHEVRQSDDGKRREVERIPRRLAEDLRGHGETGSGERCGDLPWIEAVGFGHRREAKPWPFPCMGFYGYVPPSQWK